MNKAPKIDLYTLSLFRLVAKHRGFTAASKEAGISQSALTRQIQSLEAQIGVPLFERTTRSVSITEAGALLLRETEPLPNILSGALRRIREQCLNEAREIQVVISSSLSQAHVPGIFHTHHRSCPEVSTIVSQSNDEDIIRQVGAAHVDLGIITKPSNMATEVEITHQMTDAFCAVASAERESPKSPRSFRTWAKKQHWLLPPKGSPSRDTIDEWSQHHTIQLSSSMELENFDLMNQFASMGMGCALVPQRSLSGMLRKHRVQKLKLPHPLTRTLSVIRPRHGRIPDHVENFVDGILFS